MVNSRLPPEKNEDCQDKKSSKVRKKTKRFCRRKVLCGRLWYW